MRHLHLVTVACIAALAISGCAAPSQGAPPLPAQATELRAAAGAPAGAPVLRTFTAGKTPGFRKGSVAYDITLGPDGAMWFTDGNTPSIGRVAADGRVTEYTAGLATGAKPFSIVAGPDGNLWFSDAAGAIGRVTPSGTIVEFDTSAVTNGTTPSGIAAGPNHAIWSIVVGPPSLLLRTETSGKLAVFKIPAQYGPDGSLAADAAGNLWMMTHRGQSGILLERKASGAWVPHHTGLQTARLPCCPNYAPKRITIDADGNPWFTALYYLEPGVDGNVFGTTTASGTKLFPVDEHGISLTAYPSGIATSGKGVWFVGDDPFQNNGGLWRIDASGKQKPYPVPSNSPIQIAAGRSGNLWFTAEGFGNPGQIVEATPAKADVDR